MIMLRKRGFKSSIGLFMAVVFILSCSTSSVFAASTKVVTVTQSASATGPLSAVSFIQSEFMSISTYNYDDGSFKGTLPCTGISDWTQTYDHYDTTSNVPIFKFTFTATYSGTVTAYPVTKTVTVTSPASATGPLSAASFIQSEFVSVATYNYDDGSFKGTLHCTGISNWTQTYYYYDTVNKVPIFKFTFDATYSGTVTQY